MAQFGLWQIVGSNLKRIEERSVDLEKMLQDWIEKDPALLHPGMTIVGREVNLDSRNRIDLLGLDLNGAWVVIEIKRGKLYRDTIGQALDYAAQVSKMPVDQLHELVNEYLKPRGTTLAALLKQRQIESEAREKRRAASIYVVGTGRDPAVDRMADFLVDHYSMPLTIVSFDVFGLSDGTQILVREVAELDEPRKLQPTTQGLTVEDVCRDADKNGVGQLFRKFPPLAQELGFYPKLNKNSIMYAPPMKRNRMLFTVWTYPEKGQLLTYIGVEPFAEFFGVPIDVVQRYIGKEGWRGMSERDVDRFIVALRNLFLKEIKVSS